MPEQIMPEQWYYEEAGQTCGPISRQALHELIESGELTAESSVIRDGMKDWLPVGSIAGLTLHSATGKVSRRIPIDASGGVKTRPKRKRNQLPVYFGLVAVAALLAGVGGWLAHAIFTEAPTKTVEPLVANETPLANEKKSAAVPKSRVRKEVRNDDASENSPADVTTTPAKTDVIRESHVRNNPIREIAPVIVAEPSQAETTTQEVVAPVENQTGPLVLYQELEIDRQPKLSMLGSVIEQNIQYRILSELHIEVADENGNREVHQVVKDTQLVKADAMSETMFADSLKRLIGSEFSYTLNARNEVIAMRAPADGKKIGEIEPAGAKGFLMTSVMDEDGWKELAELSFFTPDIEPEETQTWTRQMTHNFEPLGSWSGVTTFTPRGTENGVARIDYDHKLNYKPPAKGVIAAGGLSLNVKNAKFAADTAEGVIYFDHALGRVQTAEEQFHVKGSIAADALGQVVTIPVEEKQAITVRLTDQYPWASR